MAHDGLLVTVFSAPNYCDQMGNKGAFVRFNGNDMVPHFTTFEVSSWCGIGIGCADAGVAPVNNAESHIAGTTRLVKQCFHDKV